MSESGGPGATRPRTTASGAGFPQVFGAAVLLGTGIALVDYYDRKAAAILTVTLLLGVMLQRDIVGKATELIDAVSGKK